MSPAMQTLLVALIVFASAVSVLRRYAPRASWQAQARISYWLEARGPALSRRLGAALRPPLQATTGACGTGCSTCNACAPTPPAAG